MSGLKELVFSVVTGKATPSNCGDAHLTLEHQAARRKAPVAGVTTQGMVTASRGDPLSNDMGEVGHPQPSPTAASASRPRMLFTDYMAVGFRLERESLRYSRAPSAMRDVSPPSRVLTVP